MNIRFATWNIEHFNALFDKEDNAVPPNPDDETRYKVTAQRQLDAAAEVVKEVDADILLIIEGPGTSANGNRSTVKALENFAEKYQLRSNSAAIGFNSSGQQEIALMFDPEKVSVAHEPAGAELAMTLDQLDALSDEEKTAQLPLALNTISGRKIKPAPRFNTVYPFDSEDDRLLELYRFTRPPYEARISIMDAGEEKFVFRMIGAHVKSKGVYDVSEELRNEIKNLSNRRRILAECSWIRQRIEEYLDKGEPVLVAGDFNDGPGLDYHERSFGRSGVELVAGVLDRPDRTLWTNTLKPTWSGSKGWSPSTASFYQKDSGKFFNALIDFVLVSGDIASKAIGGEEAWKIWNPFASKEIKENEEFASALKDASDHFPVSFDFKV